MNLFFCGKLRREMTPSVLFHFLRTGGFSKIFKIFSKLVIQSNLYMTATLET